jgi:hypothetical protein
MALAAGLGLALGGSSFAQTTPVQPQPRDPNMPAIQNTVPEKIEGRAGEATGSTGTLSDKLQASDGVITPPAGISPDMTVRPPVADPGTTRVIPPAGSPGSSRPNADPR